MVYELDIKARSVDIKAPYKQLAHHWVLTIRMFVLKTLKKNAGGLKITNKQINLCV